ncbi:MAG: MarR family transcriptional regulator [Clostridia bacterium]|nr:MarR family transcriptional regulator [Clostridia bacterium]
MSCDIAQFIDRWYRDWFRNERMYDEWARRHGLNYTEMFALYVLNATDGCTPKYVAEFLSVSKQTINGVLDRLERRQLIERIPSAVDRRSRVVRLTGEGAQRVKMLLGELAQMEKRAFSRFTDVEIANMIELNSKLTDYIVQEMQQKNEERQDQKYKEVL